MPFQTKQLRSMLRIALGCTVLISPPTAHAWDAPIPVATAVQGASNWTDFLAEHVNGDGLVDYRSAKSDRNLLSFVAHLANTDPAELTDSDERKAFWINAYNALAIYGVTLRMPKDEKAQADFSVIDQAIDGLPPDKGFFVGIRFAVGGQRLGLDDIEKKILLRQWDGLDAKKRHLLEQLAPDQGDSRVHFVLVCCALGCPVLNPEPYVADRLDEQLDRATQSFLTDKIHSQFEATEKIWVVSELIQWYQADLINPKYTNSSRSVLTFAADNVQDSSLVRSLRTDAWSISYLKYDWRLNNWRK